MAKKPLPTPDELRQLLTYDPDTGMLTWLPRPAPDGPKGRYVRSWNGKHAGKPALQARDRSGRQSGAIFGRTVQTYRVAWAIFHGEWPKGEIDHIDGDPSNNRIENLRDVSHAENTRNAARRCDNKSGVTGVFPIARGRWRAGIRTGGREIHIGHFDTKDDAIAARKAAEARLGFHPNHGR